MLEEMQTVHFVMLNSIMFQSQVALMLAGFRNIYTKFNRRGGSHKEVQILVTLVIGWRFWCSSAGLHSLLALDTKARE